MHTVQKQTNKIWYSVYLAGGNQNFPFVSTFKVHYSELQTEIAINHLITVT